jgi:hypothetical protein
MTNGKASNRTMTVTIIQSKGTRMDTDKKIKIVGGELRGARGSFAAW